MCVVVAEGKGVSALLLRGREFQHCCKRERSEGRGKREGREGRGRGKGVRGEGRK
jgi:hypothetical protein